MITVRVPATSANCSVGFDSLGLALDWKSSISFEPASSLSISGCPKDFQGSDNLVWQAFELACKKAGCPAPAVHIHIDSDIPLARGLGSSSQCVAAGLLGARAMLSLNLDDHQLLELAASLEGHPDNAAPALFGGLCACVSEQDQILQISLDACGWHVLVVIPPYEVSTARAREVLPSSIGLHEAAMQCGRALLFEYAWVHRDEALLASVCSDVLHEPFRSRLIPEYSSMKEEASRRRLPFWISGSGSTMAFVSQDPSRLEQLASDLAELFPHCQLRLTKVSGCGAEVLEEGETFHG